MGVLHNIASTATLLIAAVTGQSSRACNHTVGASVRTTSGLVHGHRAPNATQVSEYLGIPFAQSPIGPLRFAPPVAFTGRGDIYAKDFGHDCPINIAGIPTYFPQTLYNVLAQVGQVGDNVQEDCLFVNVWSKPQSGSVKKPVLVWIYGGGFNIGGTNTSAYSGQFWVETEDVVFVNFNYRLNIFGFPGAPGITQNIGLLDQRLAIEWVRDNIEGFGGDSSRITIFGQSAGAASADYYNYAYTEDPIIAGSILQSGSAPSFGNKLPATAEKAWYAVTEKVGCGNSSSGAGKVLACMRSPNTTMIDILTAKQSEEPIANVLGIFGPTIDNKTVFSNYTALAEAGKFIKRPSIIGNNDYEAGLFILIAFEAGIIFPQYIWDDFDLGEFTCPASTAAEWRVVADVPVWRYRYFGMYPNIELPPSVGRAWHGAELLPLFGVSEQVSKMDSTWQERAVGSYLRGAWAAFAACPAFGLESYGWPRYSNTTDSMVLIGVGNDTGPSFASPSSYDACGQFPYGGAANS